MQLGSSDEHTVGARLLCAEYEERRRVGRLLHDEMQPTLASAKTHLAAAEFRLRTGTGSTGEALEAVRRELDAVIASSRELVRQQFPVLLREHGLRRALEDRVATLPVSVHVTGPEERFDIDLEMTVWLVVSETVAGAARAGASRADVRIARCADALTVAVRYDAGSLRPCPADRVRALGGTFTVESEDVCETTLRASLPCEWPSPTTTESSPPASSHGSSTWGSPSPAPPRTPPGSATSSAATVPTS